MKEKNFSQFYINILLVWLYITALIFSIYKLSFTWAYQGIYFYQQSFLVYIIIYLLAIVPLFFLPKKLTLPSDYVNVYLYIFTFVPSVVIPFFLFKSDVFNWNYIFYLIVFLCCYLILLNKEGNRKSFLSEVKPLQKKNVIPFFVIIYIIAFILFVSTFGFKFTVPSLDDVYDVRAEYKEITKGNILTRYFVGWMGYIINIFIFLVALDKKNKPLIIGTIIFQFYIFSLMALKSHLATMLLAFLLFLYFKKYKNLSTSKFILFTTLLICSLVLIDRIIGQELLEMLIIRRILVVPSQLSYYHYNFFSQNPSTYWGYSIFKGIFTYPYTLAPPNIIGEKHFGRPEMTAVVNMFMEGYTAFGYLGILIVTLLFKFLLKIIDYIFKYKTRGDFIVIILFLGLFNVLNSTSILTLLITHGILILIVVTLLYPWKKMEKKLTQ